ncbi:MAG: hypothetical protein ACUVV0_13905 [Anaerolineae bacterium]
MGPQKILLDGRVLWLGVQWAAPRTDESILCIIKKESITFVAVSGLRLVVSWQFRLKEPASESTVFMIPPTIASFLSAEAVQTYLELKAENGTVSITTWDDLGSYELRWRSNAHSFNPPEEFNRMLTLPSHLLEVDYLTISDAAHQAVARLVEMENEIHRTKLAILVDFGPGRLSINGREIESGPGAQYYFDPRLIVRALEFIKAEKVKVGLTELKPKNRAILSFVANYEDWLVHCALLSIGADTQKLYPLPPGRNR